MADHVPAREPGEHIRETFGLEVIFITVIWMIVDAFLIPGWIRESNNRLVDALASPVGISG